MHLLITYCQDTRANFGAACVLDLLLRIYPFFRAVFKNILKCNINARPVTFLLKLQIISFMSVLP